jgi:hypothetical protein
MTLTVSTGIGTAGATTTVTKLTVCKKGIVTGSFPFALNGGATFAVAVNHCVSKTVDAGQNLITELVDPTGATKLQSMVVSPQSANVVHKVKNSKSQAGYAKVNVASGADVKVTFWNEPVIRQLKVCKIAGSLNLVGQAFSFTEQAGGTIVGPFPVVAEPVGVPLNCGGLTSYPVGTVVSIAEAATPNVSVTSVTGTGVNWTTGQDATATVQAGGTTVVTYTNGNPILFTGYVEVCVQAGDASVGRGPWTFTISGNGLTTPISE